MARVRADVLVVEQGLAPSRARAQALILAGVVLTADGEKINKAGQTLDYIGFEQIAESVEKSQQNAAAANGAADVVWR